MTLFLASLAVAALLFGMPLFIGLGVLGTLYQFGNAESLGAESIADLSRQLTVVFSDPLSKLTGDQSALFLTIPYFTLAGYLIAHSQFAARVVNLYLVVMRRVGALGAVGLGVICVLIAALFTPLTGASGVTIVAIGGILFPILTGAGYTERRALGLITASGSIGLLFSPSLPVILFGIMSENRADINELYRAGILPGILLIVALTVVVIFFTLGRTQRASDLLEQQLRAAQFSGSDAIKLVFELAAIPLLYVLMHSRFMIITELGVFFLLYYFLLEVVVFRELGMKKLLGVFEEAIAMVGSIILIIFFAMILTNALLYDGVPGKLFGFISQYIHSPLTFLMLLNIFLLIVGALMDIFSAIIVIAPLIIPIAESYQIPMLHLGILFLTNLEIGYLTPPVGLNLFLSSLRFQKPMADVYRSIVPFLIALVVAQLIITYVPWLSLWWK
ncbi:MAG TPA: TRAP transporter large permease subunit [Turneriella sp.]|nr:TRAP transporter large permease subunit [Turneriella sp.]HNE19308.1 TRAP transporter large permease subunit [Turneriella sp.]HNL52986.1 TRAP transporter large permease subunit [Turneriella sp.]HNM99023.1 TRAP transporter large permease subunit [Turneriella sp.]